MDWREVEAKLCERAGDVAMHLLPHGKREGNEWSCGNLDGQPGRSLKVNVGGKPGLWRDFADSGKGGKTLMSLWCSVRAAEFRVCIREAKEFLGLRDDYERRIQPAAPGTPEKPDDSAWRKVVDTWAKCQPLEKDGPVWNYLVGKRKLDPEVLAVFDVREFITFGKWAMVFPYFAEPPAEKSPVDLGAPIPEWGKFELLDRPEGRKREWTSPAPEKSLFGVQLSAHPAWRKCNDVLICEGEKDALTWAGYGCQEWGVLPVSVPFGAKWKGSNKDLPSPNRAWLDRHWDWLQEFESVYVAMDGDDPGKRAAADIIGEIGPRRCRLVELPHKDANDCLLAGVTRAAMKACLDNAADFAPDKVKNAADFREAFLDEWFNKQLDAGLQLPWEFPFHIRPAELTVWTGIEKSGKTTLLGFVLMALIAQGERALVASLEIRAPKTLKKLSRQAAGALLYEKSIVEKCKDDWERQNYREESEKKALETLDWLARNLWLYDHTGIANWRHLIEDIRWARRRHGITQFAIDNFMRLGFVKDDYAQQAECVTALASLAMELEVHIHLVVHQNKSEGQKGTGGGKRTVSGAFEIIANAHNIVEVQRDVNKGEKVSELWQERKIGKVAEKEFAERLGALASVPDGKFILHAQRDGEQQNASKYLWFLWKSQQYVGCPEGHADHVPLLFVTVARQAEAAAKQSELPTELNAGGEG